MEGRLPGQGRPVHTLLFPLAGDAGLGQGVDGQQHAQRPLPLGAPDHDLRRHLRHQRAADAQRLAVAPFPHQTVGPRQVLLEGLGGGLRDDEVEDGYKQQKGHGGHDHL